MDKNKLLIWFEECPGFEKRDFVLRSAFHKAFETYPANDKLKPGEPTADKLLETAVVDKTRIFTVDTMSQLLLRFGADASDIVKILAEREVAKNTASGPVITRSTRLTRPPIIIRPGMDDVAPEDFVPGGSAVTPLTDPEEKPTKGLFENIKFPSFGKKKDKGEPDSVGYGRMATGGLNRSGDRRGLGENSKTKNHNLMWFLPTIVLIVVLILLAVFGIYQTSKLNTDGLPSNLALSDEGSQVAGTSDLSSLEVCNINNQDGVWRYSVTPKPESVGKFGFSAPGSIIEETGTPGLDPLRSYPALKQGEYYLLLINDSTAVYFPIYLFNGNPARECSGNSVNQLFFSFIKSAPTPENINVAYKINFSHWTGWLVVVALITTMAFALMSLSLTGNGLWDYLLFVAFTVFGVLGTKYYSIVLSYLPTNIVSQIKFAIYGAILFPFMAYVIGAIMAGSKSETREFKEEYEAGSQFKVPDSFKPVFESLSKGFGLVGGFDWSMFIIYLAACIVVVVIDVSASAIYLVVGSQIWTVGIITVLVALASALETYRRGEDNDWKSYWLGLVGFLIFPILKVIFHPLFPKIKDFSSPALAFAVCLVLFIAIYVRNNFLQKDGERKELLRDRMADGMLLYSIMMLSGVLFFVLW